MVAMGGILMIYLFLFILILINTSGLDIAKVTAHELGHTFDLEHIDTFAEIYSETIDDQENLMYSGVQLGGTKLRKKQWDYFSYGSRYSKKLINFFKSVIKKKKKRVRRKALCSCSILKKL